MNTLPTAEVRDAQTLVNSLMDTRQMYLNEIEMQTFEIAQMKGILALYNQISAGDAIMEQLTIDTNLKTDNDYVSDSEAESEKLSVPPAFTPMELEGEDLQVPIQDTLLPSSSSILSVLVEEKVNKEIPPLPRLQEMIVYVAR